MTALEQRKLDIKQNNLRVPGYEKSNKPLVDSYCDLYREMNKEINRHGKRVQGIGFAMTQKQYNGFYWDEFINL